jgi:hypothetical protein
MWRRLVYHQCVGRLREAFRAEPWRYVMSLWLLIAMLVAYALAGESSGVFMAFILVTICWFVLYGVVIGCLLLARAENRFWNWFARQTI